MECKYALKNFSDLVLMFESEAIGDSSSGGHTAHKSCNKSSK